MAYTWTFSTGGRPATLGGRKCHRGPMIDIEVRMSQPFVTMREMERERVKLFEVLVATPLWAVRTRDAVLRVLNGDLGAIFTRLLPRKSELQVPICEKRRATDIDADIDWLSSAYIEDVARLYKTGITQQQAELLYTALKSESPVQRVAGRCAVILLAAYIEYDEGT